MSNVISSNDLNKLRGALYHETLLAPYMSWKIGGAAKQLYQPADEEDLSYFLSLLPEDEAILFLGWGTNMLVRDSGFRGTVILMRDTLNHLSFDQAQGLLCVGAGVADAKVARFSVQLGLTGIEILVGIPGSVGGALAMNAGAYGHQIWDYVVEVETIDRLGQRYIRDAKEYEVGYRTVNGPEGEWFLSAKLALPQGDQQKSLAWMEEMLENRRFKHPLDLPNAGSVFRNPKEASAGQLIQRCGLQGYRIGGAEVSQKHANFIVNIDRATARDVEQLISHVQATVEKELGILLEREVKIVGE